MDKTFPHIGRMMLALNGRRLKQEAALPGRILLAMEEVTGRVREGKGEAKAKAKVERPYHEP